MKYFCVADAAGTINHCLWCDDETAAKTAGLSPPGKVVVSIAEMPANVPQWQREHYVSAGSVVARAPMSALLSASTISANGTAEAVISGLPKPCTVTISGAISAGPETVNDGSVIITSDVPGQIAVSVAAEPAYIKWGATIHAV